MENFGHQPEDTSHPIFHNVTVKLEKTEIYHSTIFGSARELRHGQNFFRAKLQLIKQSMEAIRKEVQAYLEEATDPMSLSKKSVLEQVSKGKQMSEEELAELRDVVDEEIDLFLETLEEDEEDEEHSSKRKKNLQGSGSLKKQRSDTDTSKNSPLYSKLRRLCLAKGLNLSSLGLGQLTLSEATKTLKDLLKSEGFTAEEIASDAIDEVLEKAELEKELNTLKQDIPQAEEEGGRRKPKSFAQFFEDEEEEEEEVEDEEAFEDEDEYEEGSGDEYVE